eukprot:m.55202 g.55202  ORF g.55202 m.55202 type:complete len:102 (+) comp12516_c0_seq1:92-397(+)
MAKRFSRVFSDGAMFSRSASASPSLDDSLAVRSPSPGKRCEKCGRPKKNHECLVRKQDAQTEKLIRSFAKEAKQRRKSKKQPQALFYDEEGTDSSSPANQQ